jgi:hypothetical protein
MSRLWHTKRTDGTCELDVNRGDSRWANYQPCGRPAIADGLCALHDKIEKKRHATSDADAAKQVMDKRIQAEGKALAKRLGCKAEPYYNAFGSPRTWRYERSLIVPYDILIDLLEKVGR